MSAPTSLPPPSNAARTLMKALNLLSPTTLFRTKKQLQETQASSDATKPPMPVHVVDTLAQLVDYLEENHRREEGLYRRESSALEWGELKQTCLSCGREEATTRLPDLATLSPHSVTKVIKEILGHEFEPVIPYTLSQTLLDRVAQRDEIATLNEIVEKIKLLNAAKRDFLKVFLIHLHHISTSIPCRMTAKQLATNVGVLLIRPTEDRRTLSTKDLFKQRRRLAQLMIENASALPYDSESGLNLLQLPNAELKALPVSQIMHQKLNIELAEEPNPTPTEPVHYIQVMWDATNYPQTEASLQTLLSSFGSIASLAINDSGSRAIVAFSTSEAAQAAAEADIPNVRVRRRKPRSQPLSSSAEYPPSTPAHSPTQPVDNEPSIAAPPTPIKAQTTTTSIEKADKVVTFAADTDPMAMGQGEVLAPLSPQSVQSSPAQSPHFLQKLERPPSILLVQKAMKTLRGRDEMKLEDIESLPTSPQQLQAGDGHKPLDAVVEELSVFERDNHVEPQEPVQPTAEQEVVDTGGKPRRKSLKDLLTVHTNLNRKRDSDPPKLAKLVSPPSSSTIGFISDLKSKMSSKRTLRAADEAKSPESTPHAAHIQAAPPKETSISVAVQSKTTACYSKRTQTTPTTRPLQDRGTDTNDLLSLETAPEVITSPSANQAEEKAELLTKHVVGLEQCLRDVKSELEKLAAALGAMRRSDVDRAVLQAHERLALSIEHALQSSSTAEISSEKMPTQGRVDVCQATREFVLFLETRSSTQVKILEAEVRAGQELLRLHRSQHQKEVTELETEIASLRVTCTETEKMCAELRRELRQCRNELTCHVATAASIQRDRRDVEEKLMISETKLRAKDQELLTLQLAHDEMREVAAQAQMRLDEHRGAKSVKHENENSRLTTQPNKPSGLVLFPHTTAFLDTHRKPTESKMVDGKGGRERLVPGQYSNTAELSAMQSRLQQRIHAQIETTKASLKEMQQFDTKRLFVDEEENEEEDNEPDLEQLEQQLASVRAEMDAAMDESRQKLRELLEPSPASNQSSSSSFDPSGLIEGLLAKALSDDWDEAVNQRHDNDTRTEQGDTHSAASPRRREATEMASSQQSELYKKWLRDRAAETRRGAPAIPAGVNQNSSSLREAQESMQRFQQALASMTTAGAQR